MHHYPLITTLAAAFSAAWLLGLLAQRLRLPPIVGYLLAGVAIGPNSPGFVADTNLAPQLAELGVILLMFGVGLHFHLRDLLAVKTIAVPGALGQSAAATVAGLFVFALFGWPLTAGLIIGMAMAVASTVVLIRVLMDADQLNTPQGHAAVGWLIVEDIITVVILVMIPALAGQAAIEAAGAHAGADPAAGAAEAQHWGVSLLIALAKLGVMILVVFVGGSRVVPWVLVQVARLRSRELFTLTVLVMAIAIAAGSAYVFGASMALGAFLAGMVVAQSPVSQQAGVDALPLRDAFAVLFFVAMGMLLDPMFFLDEPLLVLAGLGIILVAKPVAALGIVMVLGFPVRTALTVAVCLAQIGEFSFIVASVAEQHGLLPVDGDGRSIGQQLLVACALVTITINPILFRATGPVEAWLRRRPKLWAALNHRSDRRVLEGAGEAGERIAATASKLAVVVGYGPVGRQVDRLLREAGFETVIVDLNMDVIAALSAEGRNAIYGDATHRELLEQAGLEKATHLLLTNPHSSNRAALLGAARSINPGIRALVRTRYLKEAADVKQYGANDTVVDEVESAVALAELVLAETGADASAAQSETARVRRELTNLYGPLHA